MMMLRGQGGGGRCLFTASQWEELQHQALIFKFMAAGSPVPHDLVLPLRDGGSAVDTAPSLAFPSRPSLGLGCYGAAAQYGRKAEDPEPGRCRRTDGKKWRCSRDAYGESKYCDKHMHRGKNRSRKPVEATASAVAGDGASYRPSALSISPPTPDGPSYGYHHHRPDASSVAPLQQLHFDAATAHAAAAAAAATASPPPSFHRYAQAQYCNTSSSLFPSGYGSSMEEHEATEARRRQQHCLALGADLSLDKPVDPAAPSSWKNTEEKPLRRFFVDDWPREGNDGRTPWMQQQQDETQLSISISAAPPPPDLAIAAASRHHHHNK